MSRTGVDTTEAQAPVNRWCYLVALAFPSGTLYLTDGPKEYSYGGNTYVRGTLMGLRGMNERTDSRPGQCTVELAFTSEVRTKLADDYPFSLVTIAFAFLDANFDILGTPFDLASYFMSNAPRKLGETTTISLACEPVIATLYNANPVYPSNRDQQARYPGDTIFNGTSANQGWEFEWAGQKVTVPNGGGGGGGGGGPLRSRQITPELNPYWRQS